MDEYAKILELLAVVSATQTELTARMSTHMEFDEIAGSAWTLKLDSIADDVQHIYHAFPLDAAGKPDIREHRGHHESKRKSDKDIAILMLSIKQKIIGNVVAGVMTALGGLAAFGIFLLFGSKEWFVHWLATP